MGNCLRPYGKLGEGKSNSRSKNYHATEDYQQPTQQSFEYYISPETPPIKQDPTPLLSTPSLIEITKQSPFTTPESATAFNPMIVALDPALMHISDREDMTTTTDTIFLSKSQIFLNGKHSIRQRRQSYVKLASGFAMDKELPIPITKCASTSTVFVDDSTVSSPNLKNTIKCVSLAIHNIIANGPKDEPRVLDIFDEKLHPLSKDIVSFDNHLYPPDMRLIYKFIKTLFHAAQLTSECAIIALIYLERLLNYAEIDLTPRNWKRILLGSILLSSKVWDDQAVWNVDYCHILKDLVVDDVNEMERNFLELLQFNINVPSSTYAKYYFDLRTLAEGNDICFPLEPLNKEKAIQLEAMSFPEDRTPISSIDYMKRSHSLEDVSPQTNMVVLS